MSSFNFDIRKVVDDLLLEEKTLAGDHQWKPDVNDNENGVRVLRWTAAVLLDDATCGLTLTVKAYPTLPGLQFRVILSSSNAVWRLDFAEDEPHANSLNAPVDIRGLLITGHHYHSWGDNRRFGTAKSLPTKLPNARFLGNIRTFDSAYRWFCGETKIINLDDFGLPILPNRSFLV